MSISILVLCIVGFLSIIALLCLSPVATMQHSTPIGLSSDNFIGDFKLVSINSYETAIITYYIKQQISDLGFNVELSFYDITDLLPVLVAKQYDFAVIDGVVSQALLNLYQDQNYPFYPTLNRYSSANGNPYFPIRTDATPLGNGSSRVEVDRFISAIQTETNIVTKQSMISN